MQCLSARLARAAWLDRPGSAVDRFGVRSQVTPMQWLPPAQPVAALRAVVHAA